MPEGDPNFGERMRQLRRERGVTNPGRPKIEDKYRPLIQRTEGIFAKAMPNEAQRYVDELQAREPECCPLHPMTILSCRQCGNMSQRTTYDHKAASYLFDRIMGKPTARSENTVTVKLVEQLTVAFVLVFGEVNELPDPFTRREAFAARLAEVGAQYSGAASPGA